MEYGLHLLEDTIKTLTATLESYAKRENSKPDYIDRQNLLIARLTDAYNAITPLKHYEAWLRIEAEMEKLQRMDKYLCGHTIHLHMKPDGKNFSSIIYNPFN
jgi:hypothetical protein